VLQLAPDAPGSLAAGMLAGRRAVTTPFFGFLDDDDEYLPGAVDTRLAAMMVHPDASIVTTNGYRHLHGEDSLAMHNLSHVGGDPLVALFRENWLASCSGLYRSADCPIQFFENLPRHIHWTWLAFQAMEAGLHVVTLDFPGFRIHDTVGSSSKSKTYLLTYVELFERMLARTKRPDIARVLRSRLSQAWHDISSFHRDQGAVRAAWIAHWHSVRHPSGWKFMSYTRKLFFFPAVARQSPRSPMKNRMLK